MCSCTAEGKIVPITTPHHTLTNSRTSNNTHEWMTTGERGRESEWIKATMETGN